MLCRAELCTITRTLIACFSRRAQEPLQDPLPRTECPVSGISETLPAKDESSNNGGSKHRDAALYNKSTLFPSKGEGISTFFFLIIDFIMVKWIDTCQVSQEVFSPKRPPFWPAMQALPPCTCPSSSPCGVSIGSCLRGPRSRLRGRGRAMSDFTTYSWIPETTIKKQVLKGATFLPYLMHQDM